MKSDKDILLQLIQDLTQTIEENSNPDGTLNFDLQQGKLGILYAKLQIQKSVETFQKDSD